MRWSKTFIATLRDDPQDAEAVSHKLMVRASLIRRLSAGAYSYLPLGFRALKKAESIVREEMNAAGAAELLMPALQPVELWKKTGRLAVMGEVMIRFKDRHGKEVALGPTHEEVITDLVAKEIRSYKQLPKTLYQIQTKFRDEIRPRFGVIRSSEFIMKDAYSFDSDDEGLESSYKKMYDAYCRIFQRCGLPYIPVEADSGVMGGKVSHEFMVPSEIGEDEIAVCECGYAASVHVAKCPDQKSSAPQTAHRKPQTETIKEVDTPGRSSVEDVSALLKVKPSQLIKTLIYKADGKPVALLIRGDHEANEVKLRNFLKADVLEMADEKTILEATGGPMGFSGPVGLKVKILADFGLQGIQGGVTGANKKDKHLINVCADRDFTPETWIDARVITQGDPCPKCGGDIALKHAIEIGHTFKLGTKYSEALDARFLDKQQKSRPMVMGCYGIGVNRIVAACIEVHHDKDGIIWPRSISPYEIVLIPLNVENEKLKKAAEELYDGLRQKGLDVIIDDRKERAGVKFKDADLIGFPVQVVIGEKNLAQEKVEIRTRKEKAARLVPFKDVISDISSRS
jgi:prolyl-tRNA synthetase